MKTKSFLVYGAAVSALGFTLCLAQSGAGSAGSAGSGAGASSTGSAGTSATSGTRGAANSGSVSPALPGSAPSSSTTLPGAAASSSSTPTGVNSSNSAALPSGVHAAPAQPGISPISGLPTSQIPSTSAGTAPIGPNPSSTMTGRPSAPVTAGATTPSITPPISNASVGTAGTTRVAIPPPTAPAEAPPAAAPDQNSAWVAGHYSWNGSQWAWMSGSWQTPPQSGSTWVPGNYDPQTHLWTEGHWDAGSASSVPNAGESTGSRR